MFDYKELDDLKKAAMARDAFNEVIVYQLEQVLRELNSIGYKLYKMQNDKPVKDAWNVQS